MKTSLNPAKKEWIKLAKRPKIEKEELLGTVKEIFEEVEKNGDHAVKKYSALFDQSSLKSLRVSQKSKEQAKGKLSSNLKEAIQLAKNNIEKFHTSQKEKKNIIETTPGVFCWRESRGIEKVGIYIPGGTAPLFSTVLMLGVPAKLAGCKEIVLCTPPSKNGEIHPAILYAAEIIGITEIYAVGGIQAIAAMTFGTKSILKVDKLFGPGNQYVTAAKEYAQMLGLAIDLPAGPSELLVIADNSSVPAFVAADLLSQAEHGSDSQVILLTDSPKILEKVQIELKKQLRELPRKKMASLALKSSKAILFKNLKECLAFSNFYAPEHLILATNKAKKLIPEITNAGSVFIGNYSCESAGDYASGTNHTLPTNGFANSYSGVSLDSFLKKITFQELTARGIQNLGKTIEIMAEAEGLFAHKNAVTLRLKKLNNVKNGK
jgi:histidinol dehydrogenase